MTDLAGYVEARTVTNNDDCWIWQLSVTKKGYAIAKIGGRTRTVHKALWEEVNGPVPDGKQLDHLCRVRHCVNPAHLEPVTSRVNNLRGVGIPALNAAKTHCIYGHEFTEANTYRRPGQRSRFCRACRGRRRNEKRQLVA